MPIPASILSGINSRSVTLEGLEDGVVDAALRILLDLEGELRGLIGAAAAGGEKRVTFRRVRLKRLLEQTQVSIDAAYRQIGKITDPHLRQVAQTEFLFAHRLIGDVMAPLGDLVAVNTVTVTPNLLQALARDTVVNMGESLGAQPMHRWLQAQNDVIRAAVQQQMIRGVLIGEGTAQIMRRIRSGPMVAAKHTVETLVRTSTQAIVSEARRRQYAANTDTLRGIYQISTLDKRTSRVCIAYAGKRWRYTESGDLVPVGHDLPYMGGITRHPRCRSVEAPWVKSWKEMGLSKDEVSPTLRKLFDGSIATRDGDVLLRAAGQDLQNAVLGKTRAKLWRAGNLKVDDLVKRGKPTTLADIGRAEESSAVGPNQP